MIKALFTFQIAFTLVFSLIIYFLTGKIESVSFFSGALFATINTAFLVFIVSRLFRKKSVALSFALIIFKYTIFGLGLYFLVTSKYLIVSWFVVGLSILLPSVIGLAILYWKALKNEEQNKSNKERDSGYGTF